MAGRDNTVRENSSAVARSGRRFVFLLSAALNAALVIALVFIFKNFFGPAQMSEPVRLVTNFVARSQSPGSPTNVATESPPSPAALAWSRIETNNFEMFAANLRAVDCPERTIRDILLPHLSKSLERKIEEVHELPRKFWRTASQEELDSQEINRKISELTHRQEDLARRLFGFEYNFKGLNEWYEQAELGWIVGFLSNEKCERLSCRGQSLEVNYRDADTSRFGVTTEEDLENQRKFYQQARAAFAQDLSPSEADELELRAILIVTALFHEHKIKEAELTGTELRQIMAMQRNIFDPLETMILKDDDERIERMEIIWKKEFYTQVERLLGPVRFQTFLRANDEDFSKMCQAAEKLKLPAGTANKLYQIKQLAWDEAENVRQAPGLRRRERKSQLQQIQEQTENAVAELIGEQSMAKYRKEFGDWLKEVGK